MTCREKLAKEYPELRDSSVSEVGCPHNYGYLPIPDGCGECGWEGITCSACWDREIPEQPSSAEFLNKTMHIKDSGNRTEFATGAVRDMREGKGRCDLMPLEVVVHMLQTKKNDGPLDSVKEFMRNRDTFHLYMALELFAEKAYGDNTCTMFLEVAKHFEEGAKKYGENNWQKGIPVHCYIDSAVRHYLKWLRGDKDEPHDRAFVWNLMCCIWEVDYRPKEKEEEA